MRSASDGTGDGLIWVIVDETAHFKETLIKVEAQSPAA
jgi:hypothetical protein